MTALSLSQEVLRWVKELRIAGKVFVARVDDKYVIDFFTTTTKTRASSMVTKLELLVAGMADGTPFSIGKELLSLPPANRADLASWRVFVAVAIKKQKSPGYVLLSKNASIAKGSELFAEKTKERLAKA